MQQTVHVKKGYLETIAPQSLMDQASDEESLHDLTRGNVLVDALRDQVGKRPKATLNKGKLRVDVKIGLDGGLTRGMIGVRAIINPTQTEGEATWVELNEVPKPHEGSRHRRQNMERRHKAFLGYRSRTRTLAEARARSCRSIGPLF